MESRVILDGQITASSQWDEFYAPPQGRLNNDVDGRYQGAWSPGGNIIKSGFCHNDSVETTNDRLSLYFYRKVLSSARLRFA